MSFSKLYQVARNTDENENTLKCFRFFVLILFGAVRFFFPMVMGVASVVIGVLYKNQCPIQPKIPIFLIVFGSVIIFRVLYSVSALFKKCDDDDAPGYCCAIILVVQLIDLFTFAWIITGSFWVFAIYLPEYDESQKLYCNIVLYLFSLILLLIPYGTLSVVLVLGCLLLIFKRKTSDFHGLSVRKHQASVNTTIQTNKSLP